MTQDPGRLVLEVRAGHAEQHDVAFTPGQAVEAFSVGLEGSWRIVAAGMADVHAYFFYDGTTLFLASVDTSNPAWLNGEAASTEWTALAPLAEIGMGMARLRLQEAEEDFAEEEPPVAVRRVPRPQAKVPEARGEKKKDNARPLKIRHSVRAQPQAEDEATKLAPLEVPPAQDGPNAPLPAAGRPAEPAASVPAYAQPVAGGPPVPGPPPSGFAPPGVNAAAPFAPPGLLGPPVPAPFPPAAMSSQNFPSGAMSSQSFVPAATQASAQPPGLGAKLREQWKLASFPQKCILLLMPFAIASMFFIFDDNDKAQSKGKRSAASASALAISSAAVPSASGSASATVEAVATAAETARLPEPVATATAAPTRRGSKEPPKSQQRLAADTMAAGNYADAAKLYDQLAKEHAEVPAYREAARILRDKAGQGQK